MPRLLRHATDALIARDEARIRSTALALVATAIIGAAVRIASRLSIFNSGRKVEFDLRQELFAHLCRLAPSFYAKMPLSQVMSRMVNDLTQVRLLLGPGILNVTNTSLVYAVALPLLFSTDWLLTVLSLLSLPPLMVFARVFARRLYEHSGEAQERLARLSAKVQENLGGAMTVRAYGRELDEERAFAALNDRYLETNMKLARLRGVMMPVMGLAGALGTVVVLYVGGRRIAAGAMSVGQFVEFNAYLAALTWPTIALGWMISIWQRGMASMKRINEIFLAEPSITGGAQSPPPAQGRVEVVRLDFRYPGAERLALCEVSLTAEPGQTVVIVGRTGSGKTTLLKVLARQLEVPAGVVRLDGVDVCALPLEHARGLIAYAPQEAFLFSRTLFENVAFGAPEAGVEAVAQAIRTAQLEGDVAGFPQGVETLVGERGITLSGGQRQRTTLARALLMDAPVLLLDDTLSAVDTETEARLLAALAQRPGRRTTIVATHRLGLAAHADRVLVLEEGRVIEQGTEAELLALGGIYADMHRRQRLEDELRVKAKVEPRVEGRA